MGTTVDGARQIIDVRGDAVPVALGGPEGAPPLLWLHGEGVTSAWGRVHDRLAERFRVYAPVLPGFGGTELPSWLDTTDDVALQLAELCGLLELDEVVVAGESLGGWVAMTLALWRPQLVRGLALVSSLGLRPAETGPDLFIASGPESLRYLANTLDGSSVDPLSGDIELATALWVEQAAQARLMWERPYDRKLVHRAPHITAPVQVIWGAADRVLPPSHGAALAGLFGAPLHTIAGAGHLISVDDPDALAATITEAFGVKLYAFHLMPWPNIVADVREKYGSSWVVYPNSEYDPVLGHTLYNEYLDQLIYADEIGFDALCVNEHHQNAYGLMPSPNIMAANLLARTKQAKIAILGNGIALRRNPLRVAEEVAMLDVMSGGRVLSGFVRGIGAEYHSLNLDPTRSRSSFFEAHDLIVKAWTTPGPFEWDGEHFHYRYVNLWPRPLTQPHPPIFVPSQGSAETLRWAAEHRYPLACTFVPMERLKQFYDRYRRYAEEDFGYTAQPEQFGFTSIVHVHEDPKQAEELIAPHLDYFRERSFALPLPIFFPPGYTTEEAYRTRLDIARQLAATGGPTLSAGKPLIGTPEQIIERIHENMAECGAGILMAQFQVGDMPHDKVMRSMELFADKVLPYLDR